MVAEAKKDPSKLVKLRRAVGDIFSNPGYLMHYFGANADAGTSQPRDLSTRISAFFANIIELMRDGDPGVSLALSAAMHIIMDRLMLYASVGTSFSSSPDFALVGPDVWERVLFIISQSPLIGGPLGRIILRKVVACACAVGVKYIAEQWLSRLTVEKFRAMHLRPLQRHLSAVAVHQASTSTRKDLMEVLILLKALHDKWRKDYDADGSKIPPTEFYNMEVGDRLQLGQEFILWQQVETQSSNGSIALASVCQFPFCLSPEAKAKLLHIESQLQRHTSFHDRLMQDSLTGRHPLRAQFLDLYVTRENILQNVIGQVSSCPEEWLRLPLVVHFSSNGVAEEGVDQGGVAKEFFQLLMKAIFDESLGLFELDSETQNFWINFKAMEGSGEYNVLGKLIGLAVYNGVILDIHFPPVFYKKLILAKYPNIGFKDLQKAFPELGRGLQRLLDMEGDVEATVCSNFEVEYDYYGELRKIPLKEGGSDIPITNDNRLEFVELFTKWKLHDSIYSQFGAFADGFLELNFEDLESVARYEGEYNQQHPTVKALWRVLQSFSFEEKQAFLKFTTGSDRAPVGGLGNLIMTIQRAGPDSEALPTSHTCFNYLLLPEYTTELRLRHKLKLAINYAEGFGLE